MSYLYHAVQIDTFAAAFRGGLGKVRIAGASDVKEVHVAGAMAYAINHLQVTLAGARR